MSGNFPKSQLTVEPLCDRSSISIDKKAEEKIIMYACIVMVVWNLNEKPFIIVCTKLYVLNDWNYSTFDVVCISKNLIKLIRDDFGPVTSVTFMFIYVLIGLSENKILHMKIDLFFFSSPWLKISNTSPNWYFEKWWVMNKFVYNTSLKDQMDLISDSIKRKWLYFISNRLNM